MKDYKCLDCDCYDSDIGCTMYSIDRRYACPLEAEEICPYCYFNGEKDKYQFGMQIDTEYESELHVRKYNDKYCLLYEDENGENEASIQYCPMCGRKLKNKP